MAAALRQFGFASATSDLFAGEDKIVRLGVPPLRLEILTSVSGLQFDESYNNRQVVEVDGVSVPFLNLNDLRRNNRAAGRARALAGDRFEIIQAGGAAEAARGLKAPSNGFMKPVVSRPSRGRL